VKMSLSTKRGKQAVLEWFQNSTKSYKGVNITDFSNGFQDGLAFCACFHHFSKDSLDYDSLDSSNAETNIKLALQVAEKLNISTTLEPSNIGDEGEVFQFACGLFKVFNPDSPLLARRGNRNKDEKKKMKMLKLKKKKEEAKEVVVEEKKRGCS